MKRCCFSSNPEEIVTPKEKRHNTLKINLHLDFPHKRAK
ncbi:hypothetical protein T4C_10204 [Trichinella pseudospiralis]|uniref:Uncharacterized protein n=1 Tax=Trichinella pseudospiralis TaxID=6337 RepID=A0A0V1HN08_TRIPS|nr:hypothetical protein T4C_10204 [Trichinella pseudospiralis]